MAKTIEVVEGSGNVFADIGLPNPEERLAKADLAIRIASAIRARQAYTGSCSPHLEDRSAESLASLARAAFGLLHGTPHALPDSARPRC